MLLLVVLIFFQVAIFIFLIFLLRRVLSRNITSATERLDVLTRNYIGKQEEVQKKFNEAEDMYQKKIAEAKSGGEKIKAEIQRIANDEKDKIINKARREAEEIVKQAEKARENLISDIDKRIRNEAVGIASVLLGKAVNREIRLMIHKYMVKEFLEEGIGSISDIERDISGISEVKITSAFDLDDNTRENISSKIKEKVGRDIVSSQSIDESLIAGLVVTVGSLIIDASLKWKIKEKARNIINQE